MTAVPYPDVVRSGGVRGADVAALVTCFSPGAALPALVAAIRPQVGAVVVVDDASPPSAQLEGLLRGCVELGAVVLRHERNSGIGAALTTGAARAREELPRATALLTFDQDSLPPSDYVAALVAAANRAAAAGLAVGMVGPSSAGRVRPAAARGGAVTLSHEPVQSGLLVPLDVLDRVGGFASELFIDGVDTDLYLRARREGFVAVAAPTRLEHALGSTHVVRVAGRQLGLVHAAPFRYYYIARNRVHLIRRHGRAEPGWAVGAVLRDLRHLVVTTALVPGRRERLRQTATGLRDGVRGVLGRRPDPDPRGRVA